MQGSVLDRRVLSASGRCPRAHPIPSRLKSSNSSNHNNEPPTNSDRTTVTPHDRRVWTDRRRQPLSSIFLQSPQVRSQGKINDRLIQVFHSTYFSATQPSAPSSPNCSRFRRPNPRFTELSPSYTHSPNSEERCISSLPTYGRARLAG